MPVFVFASRSAQWLYIAISERRIGWFWLSIYLYTFRKSREFRPIAGNGSLFKVADSYTMQDDGLLYTFHLRDDCYWYFDENQNEQIDDGETWKVTAQDFVYAFQRMFLAETRSPYRETFS